MFIFILTVLYIYICIDNIYIGSSVVGCSEWKTRVFLLYSQSFLGHGVLFLLEMLSLDLRGAATDLCLAFLFLVCLSSCCPHFQNVLCSPLLFVLFLGSFFSYRGFRLPGLLLESQLVSLTSMCHASSSQLHCRHQAEHAQRPLSPPPPHFAVLTLGPVDPISRSETSIPSVDKRSLPRLMGIGLNRERVRSA